MARFETGARTQRKTLVDDQGNRYILSEERGPSRSFGMQFTVVFTEPYARMVARIKSAPALRLFALLPQYLSFTEFRQLRQDDLVQDLGISSGAASRALNELATLGAIERQGTGPTTRWRLSMEWGWQGSVKSFHAEKAKRATSKVVKLKPKKPTLDLIGPTAA